MIEYPCTIIDAKGDQRIVVNEMEHSGYPGYEPQLLDDMGLPWREDVHAYPPSRTKTGAWAKKRGRR